jgi:hypothetical protein
MARYRIQCTGAAFTGAMAPRTCTHLVVQLPLAAAGEKIACALK